MAAPSTSGSNTHNAVSALRCAEIQALCGQFLGFWPAKIDFPGGDRRETYFVTQGGNAFILTRRGSKESAELEARVLTALEPSGVTPRLKAVSDVWVIQQFLHGTRLPIVLDSSDDAAEHETIVGGALDALLKIYEVADRTSLVRRVPVIGSQRQWFTDRLAVVSKLSEYLNIRRPHVDWDQIADSFDHPRDEFIKYDARPGNAIWSDNAAYWFDWEDCGGGRRIEDLIFVLCDEWTAISAETEQKLFDAYLPSFAGSLSIDDAELYARHYGVLKIINRLNRALEHHVAMNGWRDRDDALLNDQIGNTRSEIERLCQRGRRWADWPGLGHHPLR